MDAKHRRAERETLESALIQLGMARYLAKVLLEAADLCESKEIEFQQTVQYAPFGNARTRYCMA